MCAPAPAVFGSAPARSPLSMQKNALSPATPFHRERETRLSPTTPSRRSAPGSGTQAGLPGEDCQTAVDRRRVSRRKCLWGPGICPFPTAPAPPGNSQQRHAARFCQGQNRQMAVGKERCQSANAIRYREAARLRQHRPTGKLPAAGHGPVLPRAKSPNGGWQRAVPKRKRRRVPGTRLLPAVGHGPVLPKAKSPSGGWQRAVSKCKRRQVPGSRSLPNSPPHRGAPSSGTRPGFAKGKIAKQCLAKGCVKAQTLKAFERSQSAVFPQGRARPVDCTGRPISSASTRPPRRGMRTAPSRWAITEGERPVV